MIRYYICPLVGDGSMDDPYRAKVMDYGVNHVAVVSPDPVAFPYALVQVNAVDHRALLADKDMDALPEFPLDARVNSMATQARTRMEQALSKRRIVLDFTNADGYRDVIRGIGRKLDSNFHENNFSVSE